MLQQILVWLLLGPIPGSAQVMWLCPSGDGPCQRFCHLMQTLCTLKMLKRWATAEAPHEALLGELAGQDLGGR